MTTQFQIWWCGMQCVNKVLQLLINFMIRDVNFNKITFIDWSQMFIMPKHVFYDLSYAIIMSNVPLEKWFKMFWTTSNQLNGSWH